MVLAKDIHHGSYLKDAEGGLCCAPVTVLKGFPRLLM